MPALSLSKGAIIIFAKAPVPGEVKTRMCPPLAPDEAASLHGSLVMDAVERTRSLRGVDIFLACSPGMDHPFFQTLAARHRIRLCDQVGADLGRRMDHALTAVFARGYAYALLVGTDIPNVAARHYERAKALLQTTDVVWGPTEDGGYYLVGAKHPYPRSSLIFPGQPARCSLKAGPAPTGRGWLSGCWIPNAISIRSTTCEPSCAKKPAKRRCPLERATCCTR